MADQTDEKKVEATIHPAIREFDNTKTMIARTAPTRKGALNRYEILWPVPTTDEEAKERYDCTLADLITMGVQIISHRPDYGTLFAGKDEYSKPLHENLQALADNYKPGQRIVGKSAATKAEASAGRAAKEKAEAMGFTTVDEMLAMVDKVMAKKE